jgi:hypothetical protein
VTFYSAENSIEERLRGSTVELEVLASAADGVEEGFGLTRHGA